MGIHKNSPKRIIFPGAVYYVVIKTHDNYPYFKETIFCDLFVENLKICKKLKGFKLYGFSVIYDHINLLLQPSEKYNVSQVMKSLKENLSRNVNIIAGYTVRQNSPLHVDTSTHVGSADGQNLPPHAGSADGQNLPPHVGSADGQNLSPHVSDTTSCRLRGGRMVSATLKEENFDENCDKINLDFYMEKFTWKYGVNHSYPKFKWLKSFYDHHIRFHDNIVRQENDWDYHYNYTVYNHIKHGLPADWKYTSLNYPELIDSIEE